MIRLCYIELLSNLSLNYIGNYYRLNCILTCLVNSLSNLKPQWSNRTVGTPLTSNAGAWLTCEQRMTRHRSNDCSSIAPTGIAGISITDPLRAASDTATVDDYSRSWYCPTLIWLWAVGRRMGSPRYDRDTNKGDATALYYAGAVITLPHVRCLHSDYEKLSAREHTSWRAHCMSHACKHCNFCVATKINWLVL